MDIQELDIEKAIRANVFSFCAENWDNLNDAYALAEDENIDELYELIENQDEINSLLAKTSIILLTANKYEKNMLHKSRSLSKQIKKFGIHLSAACERYTSIYGYWFETHGYSVLHIHANVTGSYTIGGSADVARWIVTNRYLLPTAVISFGVCFGTREKTNKLGDVIISKKIYPYFVGAKVQGDELHVVDDNMFNIDDVLFNRIMDLKNNNKFKPEKLGFHVDFQNYITGEAVVSSQTERDKYVHTTTQDVYAGEMEGYGVFKECKVWGIPCLVLKSICDWGTEKNFDATDKQIIDEFKTEMKQNVGMLDDATLAMYLSSLKDRIQAYAAGCAANTLDIILDNHVFAQSVLDNVRPKIRAFNGAATTCGYFRDVTIDIAKSLGLTLKPTCAFLHKCIKALQEEGLAHCEAQCILDDSMESSCTWDASVDVVKGN